MKASEFAKQVKRRKTEITRRINKNKGSNRLLNDKIQEQRDIKMLQNALTEFRLSYYDVVTDFHN